MQALITGASRGIGKEAAKILASKGYDLILLSRNVDSMNKLKQQLQEEFNVQVQVGFVDLSNLTKLEKQLGESFKNLSIDVLINNAGLLINKRFDEFSIEESKEMFDVNFHAPILIIRNLLNCMGLNGLTHVVNISSMGGFQGSSKFPGLSYYSASKAALACMTECLAEEYKSSSIRFNSLALGAVQTEMLSDAFPGYKAPLDANEMASFIVDFAISGGQYFNGKVIPVSLSTP